MPKPYYIVRLGMFFRQMYWQVTGRRRIYDPSSVGFIKVESVGKRSIYELSSSEGRGRNEKRDAGTYYGQ
jgi:hypothetical protein